MSNTKIEKQAPKSEKNYTHNEVRNKLAGQKRPKTDKVMLANFTEPHVRGSLKRLLLSAHKDYEQSRKAAEKYEKASKGDKNAFEVL